MTDEELIEKIINEHICKVEHVDALLEDGRTFDTLPEDLKATIEKRLLANLAEWQQYIMKRAADKGAVNIDTFNLLFKDIRMGECEKLPQQVTFEGILNNIRDFEND